MLADFIILSVANFFSGANLREFVGKFPWLHRNPDASSALPDSVEPSFTP